VRKVFATILAVGTTAFLCAAGQSPTQDDFSQDFDFAWRTFASTYAYFDLKATAWNDVPRLYSADLQRVTTRDGFVGLLEHVLDEVYDPHTQLTVNTPTSPRLVPSGTDLWAAWRGEQATITEVRADSDAQRAGIKAAAVVISINDVPIADAVESRLGRTYPHSNAAARDWALRAVLAGTHNARRVLRLRDEDTTRVVELAARDQFGDRAASPVTHSELRPGIGYIRFNDSLGDDSAVEAFDRALGDLRNTRALIVDLRDTPSGGNTMVARGIMGRFVSEERPYQKHVLPSEEREAGIRRSWLELVSPRGAFVYRRPIVALVDHWTGSMGEGLAIGLDATSGVTVIGTSMAGLLGATDHVRLPRTGIGMNVPTERLYHVNGTPREAFQPKIIVDAARPTHDQDPFVSAALRRLGQR
jgi:C-terminal processing protease CtpA/Prc